MGLELASRRGRQGRMGRVLVPLREFLRKEVAAAIAVLCGALVVWAIGAWALNTDWLPTPVKVFQEIWALLTDGKFPMTLIWSLGYAAGGFAIAAVLGLAVGAGMGLSRHFDGALSPYVNAMLLVPPILLAPIFMAVFGLSLTALIVLIVVFAFPMITISVRGAIRGVDPSFQEVAWAFGAGRYRQVFNFVLRAALPRAFAGLHLGMALSMKGMLIGELFLAVIGVGAVEATYTQTFNTVGLWALAVILIVVSIMMVWIVSAVDFLVNYWAK